MSKKKSKKKNSSNTKKEKKVVKEELVVESSIPLCSNCSTPVTSKYCPNCGKPVEKEEVKQEENKKLCPNCFTLVTSKYCPNCGKKVDEKEEEKKEEQPRLCSKCSTPVTSKYCPNCGTLVLKDVFLEEEKEPAQEMSNSSTLPEPVSETKIEKETEPTVPSVSSIGMPGVVPIPNAGMDHNVIKQYNFSNEAQQEPEEKKSKSFLIPILVILIFIIIVITIVILVTRPSKKETSKENKNSHVIPDSSSNVPDSNSNSKEEDKDDALVLSCVLTSDYEEGIKSISKSTYTFKNNKIVESLEEEILEFDEKGMQYYNIYLDNVREELLDDSYYFDNTTLEMIKTENRVGLSYRTDLTADPKNSNNNLDLLGTTYQSAKKELEKEGYQCK